MEELSLEDGIGQVQGFLDELEEARESLATAEVVEKMTDFKANLIEAKRLLRSVLAGIDELLEQAEED